MLLPLSNKQPPVYSDFLVTLIDGRLKQVNYNTTIVAYKTLQCQARACLEMTTAKRTSENVIGSRDRFSLDLVNVEELLAEPQ